MLLRRMTTGAASGTEDRADADPISVRLVEGLPPELDDVAASAESGRQFLTTDWFRAAVAAYGPGPVRTLVGDRDNGRSIIALPLVPAGPRYIGAKSVPGSYWPFRSFPIAADVTDSELTQFLRHAVARSALGPVWRLGPIYSNDTASSMLGRIAKSSGWTVITRRVGTDFALDIGAAQNDGSWPRGSTLKKNRYFEKQLATLGNVEWRRFQGTEWSAAAVDLLARTEARSWVGSQTDRSAAKFVAATHRSFWETAVHDARLAERVSATLLVISGEPIAFSLELDSGSVRYVIANGYDPAFAKYSPGRVLSYRSFVEAMGRGIRHVDWGAGDSGYKQAAGATPGPEIIDLIVIRGRSFGRFLAVFAEPLWRRSGHPDQST